MSSSNSTMGTEITLGIFIMIMGVICMDPMAMLFGLLLGFGIIGVAIYNDLK